MRTVDIAIIGAGPAGSAAAIRLAQQRYDVALIDKRQFPREKLCGDFINPINWPVFRALGVTDQILAQPHSEVSAFRLTTVSGREAEAPFGPPEPPSPTGLGLRRAHLDHALVQRAATLGVAVRPGRRIECLERTALGWKFRDDAGEEWQAKVLVGADGRNSWVAQRLGMNRRAGQSGHAVGFQSRLKSAAMLDGKIEIHLIPGGYAGVIALGDGTINLCLAIDKRKLGQPGAEYLFAEILPRNPRLKSIIQESQRVSELRSAYPLYFPPRRCYDDALLLAGDAARVSEPVTGEGIYFALRSGSLAAEAAAEALAARDLSAGFLRRYERRCRSIFRRRMSINAIMRLAVYRPALLEPLMSLFARKRRLLDSLVGAVCAPEAPR